MQRYSDRVLHRLEMRAAILLIGLLSHGVGWTGNVGLLPTSRECGAFDSQVIELIAQQASVVALDCPASHPVAAYRYGHIIEALKKRNPQLTVLTYTWGTVWYNTRRPGMTAPKASGQVLAGYQGLGPLLLPGQNPTKVESGETALYGDPRQREYRSWVTSALANAVSQFRSDGVFVDMLLRNPRPWLAYWCNTVPGFCTDYQVGVDSLLREIQGRLKPRKVFFNGLWASEPGMLEGQLKLLDFSDGAAIEFFGYNPNRVNAPAFRDGILPFLEIMGKRPDKEFLVFGRAPYGYQKYEDAYRWQRYLYASYLLAAGPKTHFHFLSSYSVSTHQGRTGGLDFFHDWNVDLGAPLAPYQMAGPLYVRRFSKGTVVVNPHDGKASSYLTPHPVFTPEGARLTGTVQVPPGAGLLLMDSPPAVREVVVIRQGKSSLPLTGWRALRQESAYIALDAMAIGEEWEHDLLLDPIRVLKPGSLLHVTLRSTDPTARLLFEAELDDVENKQFARVISLSTRKSDNAAKAGGNIPFRFPSTNRTAYIPAPANFSANGDWESIDIDGRFLENLEGKRYTFRRWKHVRIVGQVDIKEIYIRSGER